MVVRTPNPATSQWPGRQSIVWSLRNQILIPIVAIQVVTVAIVAVTAATHAAHGVERQIIDRLNGVVDTLGHSNFPYTPSVLANMRGLSGAHFVVFGEDGRVTETTLPMVDGFPLAAWSSLPDGRLDSRWAKSPTLLWNGTRYFAVPLRLSSRMRELLLVLYPETSWRQARWEAAASPLAVGLGSLALMVIVTGWTAHRISARISQVQQRVARIAAGDFAEFDPGRRGDEVHDLARSINRMCAQLREMREAVRQSERSRLLAQLAAGWAHQLRNSLTGARMSVQLHARRFPPRRDDETLDIALRQLAMSEEQIKGLLSLGRVERRPPALCELGRLLDDVARLVGPSCQHGKVELRRAAGGEPLHVLADESGLRAAILNLVLNAIEAAGPGGEVGLGTSSRRWASCRRGQRHRSRSAARSGRDAF